MLGILCIGACTICVPPCGSWAVALSWAVLVLSRGVSADCWVVSHWGGGLGCTQNCTAPILLWNLKFSLSIIYRSNLSATLHVSLVVQISSTYSKYKVQHIQVSIWDSKTSVVAINTPIYNWRQILQYNQILPLQFFSKPETNTSLTAKSCSIQMLSFLITFQVMLVLQVLLSTDVLNFNFHVLLYADACKISPLESFMIHTLWVHPLSPFHHPSCAVASQFGLGWCLLPLVNW